MANMDNSSKGSYHLPLKKGEEVHIEAKGFHLFLCESINVLPPLAFLGLEFFESCICLNKMCGNLASHYYCRIFERLANDVVLNSIVKPKDAIRRSCGHLMPS